MSNTKFHISDYSLKDGKKFDVFSEYTDEQFWIVQMHIEENAQERRRQERKAERDFKLALIFLGCLGTLCVTFFVAVLTSSYLAVNEIQQQTEQSE